MKKTLIFLIFSIIISSKCSKKKFDIFKSYCVLTIFIADDPTFQYPIHNEFWIKIYNKKIDWIKIINSENSEVLYAKTETEIRQDYTHTQIKFTFTDDTTIFKHTLLFDRYNIAQWQKDAAKVEYLDLKDPSEWSVDLFYLKISSFQEDNTKPDISIENSSSNL